MTTVARSTIGIDIKIIVIDIAAENRCKEFGMAKIRIHPRQSGISTQDRHTVLQFKRRITIEGVLSGGINALGYPDFVADLSHRNGILEIGERVDPGRAIVGANYIVININDLGSCKRTQGCQQKQHE